MAEPFTLSGTERFRFDHAVAGNPAYCIDIARPEGQPPPDGWPSIWLLDAHGCFGTCVEALRRMERRTDATGVVPMVVVGISSWATGYDVPLRQRDFTSVRKGETADSRTGGAPEFLALLDGQLLKAVSQRTGLDPRRRTLFGHSLAGYFALWVLCHHPESFSGYAAVSPSIWWDRDALFEQAAHLHGQNKRLFVSVGEWEEALPPWQMGLPGSAEAMERRTSRRMVGNVRDLAARMEGALGAERVECALMAGEDHASIVSTAMPRALRLASRA